MTEKGWEYNTAKKEIILHDIKCLKLAVRMMFSGIEKGWYRIMTELDEDYLFPPELFEIIEE